MKKPIDWHDAPNSWETHEKPEKDRQDLDAPLRSHQFNPSSF